MYYEEISYLASVLKAHCWEWEYKLVTEPLFIVVRELSHAVPDMSIHGSLSSVHCSLDLEHYQLIRGLLENNLGEPVEDFLRPYNLQDPSTYVRKQATTCTLTSQLTGLLELILFIHKQQTKMFIVANAR